MFIQTEATPNPATLKFLPGKPVLGQGTLDMPNKEAATQSPLAERLRVGGETPEAGEEFFAEGDAATVATIKELLETRVRPAVAGDGGDITFRGFRDGVVYLAMKGACSGCPSSTATLKHGIQNLLRHFVPDVREVQSI